MRLVLPGALCLLLASAGPLQEPVPRKVVETGEDGVKVEREVAEDFAGRTVPHGTYESTAADGTPIAEGHYRLGARDGAWVFYHPNGAVASRGEFKEDRRVGEWVFFHPDGSEAASGLYQRGLRRGRWTYLDETGNRTGESGTYSPRFEQWDTGYTKLEGEFRFKFRHGVWRWYRQDGVLACEGHYDNDREVGSWSWYWPDGTPLLTGAFREGKREGDWLFHHPNGLTDPGFLSLRWAAGEPAGRSEPALDETFPIDLGALPDPKPYAGLTGPDQRRIEELVRLVRTGTEEDRAAVRPELYEWGVAPVPRALHYLVRLDLERDDDRAEARHLYREVVVRGANGFASPWVEGADPVARHAQRLAILRWLTIWRLAADDHDLWRRLWEVDAGRDPEFLERDLRGRLYGALLEDPHGLPAEVLASAVGGGPLTKSSRDELLERYGGTETKATLDAGLAWLASHQAEDGRWDCDGFAPAPGDDGSDPGFGQPYHDVAVTGLALMAFVGGGNTLQGGAHRKSVHDAVDWLRRKQDPETGLYETPENNTAFMYCHVMATWAMADVLRDSTNPKLRREVQHAVDALLAARNPGAGWRYTLQPGGESDSSMTAWVTSALMAARRAGLEVDPAAFAGALAWFDSMTDDVMGRTGYYERGSPSVRFEENLDYPYDVSETLTAAALWCRFLCGQTPESKPLLGIQARLVSTRPPEWIPDAYANDMIGWYFGTLAMFQMGGELWESWNRSLRTALVAAQRTDGPQAGSWDPVGPWGYLGGRVYSTALCALTLTTYHRYERFAE